MNQTELLQQIQTAIHDILVSKGKPTPAIEAATALLGGQLGIDSLDLAGLVVDLQIATGTDPFADGFKEFQTAGELAVLFSSQPDPAGAA